MKATRSNKKHLKKRDRGKIKSPPYFIQLIDHYTSIFGVVISIFFAAYAIHLTIQQNKTDKRVDILEDILCTMQDVQFQNQEMIHSLSEQIDLQNAQLSLMVQSNKTLERQFSFLVNEKIKEYNRNWWDYSESVNQLAIDAELFKITSPNKDFLELDLIQKELILKKVIHLGERIRDNPIVGYDYGYRYDWGFFVHNLKKYGELLLNQSKEKQTNEGIQLKRDEEYLDKIKDLYKNIKGSIRSFKKEDIMPSL